jgi:flagellar hook assembly protein FlgD
VVKAYNSAGEEVKIIAQEVIDKDVTGFDTMVGNTLSSVFNPSEEDLKLRFTGIWTAYQVGVPYVDFAWDGTNDNGLDISQGVYYIKVVVTDEFGHANTTVKEVQLIRSEKFVRVSIYNAAGELVRRIEQSYVPGAQVSLEVEDVFHVSGGNNATTIKLGAAGTMKWDGKNSLGALVGSGIYEVSLEVKESTGLTMFSTKTITVLNESPGVIMSDVKFCPNPAYAYQDDGSLILIAWTGAATGKITIRIYNTAGELAARIESRIEKFFVDWDMTSPGGGRLAPDFYVAVVEAESTAGVTQKAVVKLAIIRK